MLFNDNIQTLRVNITDMEALKIREVELARGAFKVNISRLHKELIQIEIFRVVDEVTKTPRLRTIN